MSQGSKSGNSGGSGGWLVAVVVVALIGTWGIWIALRPEPKPVGPGPKIGGGDGMAASFSVGECLQLIELKNRGVAYLEANQLSEAEEALTELTKKLPREPVAVRNLAICKLLMLDKQLPDGNKSDPAPALAAIDACKKVEPKSAAPYFLAARLALKRDDKEAAVLELKRATELAPEDPATWYELYSAARYSDDEPTKAQAIPALEAALKCDPKNLFLLVEHLIVQAEGKDAAIAQTLATIENIVPPIREFVKTSIRMDVMDLIGQAKEAAEKEQWPTAMGRCRLIQNGIRPQMWSKSDLGRLDKSDKNVLVLVAHEFSAAVCPDVVSKTAGDDAAIDVKFRRLPAESQLPAVAGVKALNLADFDQDYRVDVIALTDGEIQIFSRPEKRGEWKRLLATKVAGTMGGLLVADLDRDKIVKTAQPSPASAENVQPAEAKGKEERCHPGDVEIVAFGPAGVQVYRNDKEDATGKRTLSLVPQNEEFQALRNVTAGVLADVDHDGDLDLVLATGTGMQVWSNLGNILFENITSQSALPPTDWKLTSLVAVDWDRDLDLDILVSSTDGSGILENLQHGTLRWEKFEGPLTELSGSKTLALLESDGNMSWDVLGAGKQGVRAALTRTVKPGGVMPLVAVELDEQPAARLIVADFDNDAAPDAIAWDAKSLRRFAGTPGGRKFIPYEAGDLPTKDVTDCVAGDIDGDGDLDLAIALSEEVVIFDNEGGNRNHWLAIRAQGEDGDKLGDVNHTGIGSLIEILAGPRYQAQIVTGQVTHFGLGKVEKADVLRVVWTNGVPQPVVHPEGDTTLCRVHDPKGSCPYLYTWDGTKYAFCTDACWNAPLGLQLAQGVFAQPRAWEYLTIPGDRLKPRNGRYSMQMTEELWEATYLDRMELIAVDHPEELEIFSNEKVGPPDLAEFKVHTVRRRQLPVSARDKHGRDVLDRIAREDGVFMKGYDSDQRRGLVDEHFLELDLGPLEKPKDIKLFLTGWMYPVSTSLNINASQSRTGVPGRPPALRVPDAKGQWTEVRPFMGFPGGKTKTIVIDLAGAFLADDYRLRIVTNMEFCWDAAFFTVDEEPAELRLIRLPPVSADLHYRGFSEIVRQPDFGPDFYDYSRVRAAPKWPPMDGNFTRFGNVLELLTAEDDRMVIFGAGDELTIEFDVPNAPEPGWKRDFLLYNMGWDKDADLNVVTGQAVEPLPFGKMSGYPYRADEAFPDSAPLQRYLKTYQTRQQSAGAFWRQLTRGMDQFLPVRRSKQQPVNDSIGGN